GFTLVVSENGTLIKPPVAHAFYNGRQINLQVPCVFNYESKQRLDFEINESNKINGCLVLISAVVNNNLLPNSGALWLSEKVWDTNFAKLYIYEEKSDYFKKVYSDNTPLAVYQGRVIGPIKIWEVHYPDYISVDEFYLQQSEYG
ncbi:MAG: hypothetical protein ACK4NX_03395, partial [Candidatus Paceibacteria bacterium]